jgi:signal transduction histidine kinase
MAAINYRQSLVERDKTALAREIHDDLGGYLMATAMDVRRLSDYSPVTTKVSRTCLKESRTL